ncbi:MAG: hypothetical protein WBN89_09700 [Prochlorococcaceae cyanobacterium]
MQRGETGRYKVTSTPPASRTVDALAGLGILRELTGRRRDRVFAYDGYLRILSEGTGLL